MTRPTRAARHGLATRLPAVLLTPSVARQLPTSTRARSATGSWPMPSRPSLEAALADRLLADAIEPALADAR